MTRALVGLWLSWLALQLAELARRCLPPKSVTPASALEVRPVPATLIPPNAERYVRELSHLELVRADAMLHFALGHGPVFFNGYSFAKIADPTWRQ